MADVVIDLNLLTPEQGFRIQGFSVPGEGSGYGYSLGWSVSDAGDVNGDGFDDVIVGAPTANQYVGGLAYVVFGTSSGTRPDIDVTTFGPSDGFVIRGNDYGSGNLGFSVSSAGDINGDGIGDLIVGSPIRSGYDVEYSSGGKAYVIYGVAGATLPDIDLGALTPSQGFIIDGEDNNDRNGFSVSGVGDFNGDGIGDLIVGAPNSDRNNYNGGSAYLIFGKIGTGRADVDAGSLPSSDGFALRFDSDGGYDYSYAGWSVSGAGDVNGDGFADLIIGAPYQSTQDDSTIHGQAFVIFGEAGATHPDVDLLTVPSGFTAYSTTYDRFGFSVSSAGDLNGDGLAEVIIGWPDYQSGGATVGAAQVLFNGPSGPQALSIHGERAGDNAGISVSAAGDVNGDGLGDLIIGVPGGHDASGDAQGKAYVVYGKTDLLATGVDLATLTSTQGFEIRGLGYDYAGFSVSAAGDVNGDGFDDLIVGAPYDTAGGDRAGAAYVIYGFAPPPDDTNWTKENATPISGNVLLTIPHNGAPDSVPRGDVADLPFTLTDPFLELRDANDNLLDSNDDGGSGSNSQIFGFVAPETGTYHLAASGIGSSVGTYRVTATKIADAPDDFAGDASTLGTVAPGSSATGNLEVTGDSDWFRINLISGNFYQFDLKGASTGDGTLSNPVLELRDASGVIIATDDDSGLGQNSEIWGFRAPAVSGGGTYYLSASSPSGGKGTYTVSATQIPTDDFAGDTATTGSVALGGSANGNIQFAGDSDWFTVFLEGGATYRLDLRGNDTNAGPAAGTLPDPLLEVRDSEGALITSDNDSGAGLNARIATFVAPSSGLYHLAAKSADGTTTGTYTLDAAVVDDHAGSTATSAFTFAGGDEFGTIEALGDNDWFQIFLNQGATYSFELRGSATSDGSLPNPFLEVRDSTGALVTSDDDSSAGANALIASFVAPTSGQFFIAARSADTGTGTYHLTSTLVDDYAASAATSGSAFVGGSSFGTIETAGDNDWFAVTLTAGQSYTFDLLGSATANGTLANPLLQLRDAAGTIITSDDDSGTGADAQIAGFVAPTSGTYFLSALGVGAGTGSYRLSVTGADDFAGGTTTNGSVTVGGSALGALETFGDSDWFRVSLTAGTKYVFDVKGNSTGSGTLLDPTLELHDATGALIDSDDNDGFGTDAQIWGFVAPTTGTYYLAAGSSSGTGTYTVSAAPTGPDDFAGSGATTGVVAVDGSRTGTIETTGDADWFKVNLEEGATYQFDLEGALGTPVVTSTGTFDLTYGRLTLNADGSYSYALYTPEENPTAWRAVHDLPEADPPLVDRFLYDYVISFGEGGTTGTATLAISIFGDDNVPPVVPPTGLVTTELNTASVAVPINATDADGDVLSYALKTAAEPAHGTVSFDPAAGTFVFTPTAGFVGFDSFTLVVSDGNGGSAEQAVAVTVFPPQPGAPVVDSPVRQGGTVSQSSSPTVQPIGTGLLSGSLMGDFNGDSRDDILWRNDAGQLSNWLGNAKGGFAVNDANALALVATSWHIVGTADFNGDGRDDLLWRNSDGHLSDWLSTPTGGFTPNDAAALTSVPTSWQVVGTGDFNGDSRGDILWRNSDGHLSDWLSTSNGGFTANDGLALAHVPTDWQVAGTGDFNGDKRDDILWRNATTGQLSDWLGQANGAFAANDGNAMAQVPASWHVVGSGDFNGDGRADILWRNDASGAISDWLGQPNGGFTPNDAHALTQVPLNWTVAGTGDFNGDGRDDILWRNADNGTVSNWLGQTDGGFAANDANALVANVSLSWHTPVFDSFLP